MSVHGMSTLRGYVLHRRITSTSNKRCTQFYFQSYFSSEARADPSTRNNPLKNPIYENDFLRLETKAKERDLRISFHNIGWVPFYQLKEAVINLSKPDNWNTKLARLVLQSCGNKLATCQHVERVNASNVVWGCFKKASAISVDEYNILLAVDAENSHYRPEILSDMETQGLLPTGLTYNLLLQSSVENHNRKAFDQIRSVMNTKKIDSGENLDSLFIRLYALDKNLDEIRYIHDTIRRVRNVQTDLSYYALMRAYASMGQLDLLLNCTDEAFEKINGRSLSTHQLAYIAAELVKDGDASNILLFVRHIQSLGLKMSGKDMNWLTAYLTSRNHGKVAYQLIIGPKASLDKQMPNETSTVNHHTPLSATLVFVLAGYWNKADSPDELLAILRLVEDTLSYPSCLETALHGALRQERWDLSWSIIREMHKMRKELRSQFFWPLLSNVESVKGIFQLIETMTSMGVILDTETIKFYIIQKILPQGVDQGLLEERLRNAGLRNRDFVPAFVMYFLENDRLDLAADIASRLSLHGEQQMIQPLATCYLRTLDDESMIKILKLLSADKMTATDWVGEILLRLLKDNLTAVENLLPKLTSARIIISSEVLDALKGVAGSTQVDASGNMIESETKKLRPRSKFIHPNSMSIKELEDHLVSCKANNMDTRGTLRKLFMKHTNNRNLARAEELLQELLQDSKLIWSPGMLISRMYFHAILGEAEKSFSIYKHICEKFPDVKVDSFKIATLVESLIKANKTQDAFLVLDGAPNFRQASREQANYTNILEAAAKNHDIKTLRQLTVRLIEKKYVVPKNSVLSYCVNYFLQRGKIIEAVREFKSLNANYGMCPCRFDLLVALQNAILKGTLNNADILKDEVIECLQRNGLYEPTLEMLAAAEVGDRHGVVSMLQQIVKNGQWGSIEWQCKRWVISNNRQALELLLESIVQLGAKVDVSSLVIALGDLYHYEGETNNLVKLSVLISDGSVDVNTKCASMIEQLLLSSTQSDKSKEDGGALKSFVSNT